MNKKALWTNVSADDSTAKKAIIASNDDNKGELIYIGLNVWASCDSGCLPCTERYWKLLTWNFVLQIQYGKRAYFD